MLARPPREVFELVTNPGRWHTWHPNTRDVDVASNHPLRAGEQVVERIKVGPFRGVVTWRVLEAEPPHRWVLFGDGGRGFHSELEYTLAPEVGGTRFKRVVRMRWPWWFPFRRFAMRTMSRDAAALQNLARL